MREIGFLLSPHPWPIALIGPWSADARRPGTQPRPAQLPPEGSGPGVQVGGKRFCFTVPLASTTTILQGNTSSVSVQTSSPQAHSPSSLPGEVVMLMTACQGTVLPWWVGREPWAGRDWEREIPLQLDTALMTDLRGGEVER